MDVKKLGLAILATYVFLLVTNYLIHAVWLMPVYLESLSSWRPLEDIVRKTWILWIGQLVFTAAFAYVYTRGLEAKHWVGQGLRYGILMVLLVVIPATLNNYVAYRVRYPLALEWMAAGAAQMIVMGLIVAGIYRKPSSQ